MDTVTAAIFKATKENVQKVCLIVIINFYKAPAYDENSCGYSVYDSKGSWLEGVYTRVHRDQQIINAMRNWMNLRHLKDFKELGLNEKCLNIKTSNSEFLNFIEN